MPSAVRLTPAPTARPRALRGVPLQAGQGGPLALLTVGLALTLLSAPAAAQDGEEKRLVVLPLTRGDNVPARTFETVQDTMEAEAAFAAKKRSYRLVPLRKVAGLEKEALACRDAACRARVTERAGATHALTGKVDADGDAYKVELVLEDKDGQAVSTTTVSARAFMLTSKLQEATAVVLEEASPREAVTRDRLASTALSYEQAGRPKDADRTYRRAIALNPFAPEAARLMVKVVHVWERAGDVDAAGKAFEELLATYGPSSPWGKAKMGGQEIQDEVSRAATAYLLRVGKKSHEPAIDLAEQPEKAADRRALLETALQAYERALALYPEGPDRGEPAFLAGEVAYELGRYQIAADRYLVARDHGTAERQAPAAVGLCFALEGVMREKGLFDANKSHKVPTSARRLPSLVVRYVEAAEALAARFPAHKDAATFLLRAGQAELAFGQRERAKQHLQAAVENAPTSDAAQRAKSLLGKI